MTSASACLQLDMGNSSAKWRLVDAGAVLTRGKYIPADAVSREQLLACCGQGRPAHIWIASVASARAEADILQLLQQRWPVTPWLARTQRCTADLRNSYRDPERMGVDRWLVMLAARRRTRNRLCVVDAGSALTIDIVSAAGQHEGGYIIPGPALMERALLLDTDRVRFEEKADHRLDPGASTAEAVRHGIALASAGAVCLAMERMRDDPPELFYCGGGGEALLELVGKGGVLAPDLVFEGLEIMAAHSALT